VGEVVDLARRLGVECDAPEILRDECNLVIHLAPSPVVARRATVTAEVRGPDGARDAMQRSVDVAVHLAQAGASAIAPLEGLPPGPHALDDGGCVTFLRHVDHDAERPLEPDAAAASLRAVHEALRASPPDLPRLAPLAEVPAILDALTDGPVLTASQGGALLKLLARARAVIDDLGLPEQALHGDASLGNVLCAPEGPVWFDFEDACTGPIEWDLACLVATARAFGKPSRPEAEAVLSSYGALDERRLRPFIAARIVQALAWGLYLGQTQPHIEARVRGLLALWLEDGWMRFGV
jgi:hypothetical protein